MKKTLKISFLTAILVAATLGDVVGQDTVQKRSVQDTVKKVKVGSRLDIPKDALGRKKFERDHYRRTLGLDSSRAEQVLKVQSEYKAAMSRVASDTSLNDLGKRAAIDRLIGVKNAQLERLLTPAQQSKLIPTTERRTRPANRP